MRHTGLLLLSISTALACRGDSENPDPPDEVDAGQTEIKTDPFEDLPTGEDQWNALCAKGYADTISEAFCAGQSPPAITSFAELRTFLGLSGDNIGNGSNLRVTGVFHSTAVSGRSVTPLNPRVFFLPTTIGNINPTNPQPDPRYNIIAFSRGETFAELASKDRVTGEARFFLFRFKPACEDSAAGCNNADLFLPSVESGWVDYTLYDDETIENTVFACLRCHTNVSGRKILRMQELRNPWAHWFYEETNKNIAAIEAFEAAHAGSRYGDLPATTYRSSRPSNLQRLIQNNDSLNQPNEFDTDAIEMELTNTGKSPTWNQLYAEVVAGRAIPIPYFDNPPFAGNWDYSTPFQPVLDPQSRVAQMINAYKDVALGIAPRDQMPDISDIFLPEAVDVLYRPAAGSSGQGMLVQICSQCHNDRVDPSLTRARFNVARLDAASKAAAVERLNMPAADIRMMPPNRFYSLTDAERQLLIDELSR